MTNELELLRQYADTGSEEAFRHLVRQRVDFVYATALRVTADSHLADEVTQTVFTDLARKAKSLRNHPLLSGWLHPQRPLRERINALHQKLRYEKRQLKAEPMNQINSPETGQGDWREIRPQIDGLLNKLNERDRTAVILRFFEGCSFSDIGAHLHLSEDAARMCVSRALDRLHDPLGSSRCGFHRSGFGGRIGKSERRRRTLRTRGGSKRCRTQRTRWNRAQQRTHSHFYGKQNEHHSRRRWNGRHRDRLL